MNCAWLTLAPWAHTSAQDPRHPEQFWGKQCQPGERTLVGSGVPLALGVQRRDGPHPGSSTVSPGGRPSCRGVTLLPCAAWWQLRTVIVSTRPRVLERVAEFETKNKNSINRPDECCFLKHTVVLCRTDCPVCRPAQRIPLTPVIFHLGHRPASPEPSTQVLPSLRVGRRREHTRHPAPPRPCSAPGCTFQQDRPRRQPQAWPARARARARARTRGPALRGSL